MLIALVQLPTQFRTRIVHPGEKEPMKKSIKSAALTAFVVATLLAAASAFAADNAKVAGDWNLSVETPNGTRTPVASFKQEGENLTGTYKGALGEAPLKGTIKGNEIKFTVTVTTPNGELALDYSGTVDGDSMKGSVKFGQAGEGTWTGKKKTTDGAK
jgi:hypothetical protein